MTSLRRYLIRSLLGVIVVLGGMGTLSMYLAARMGAYEQFDAASRARAIAIASLTEALPDGSILVAVSDAQLSGFGPTNPRRYFEIWDAAGHPRARSASLGQRDLPAVPKLTERPTLFPFRLPTGAMGRAVGLQFVPKGATQPYRLVVASTVAGLNGDLNHVLQFAAICGLVLLAATVWIVPRVLRRGLEPLARLGEQAARIDSRSLATRFPVGELPEELQAIAGRLNGLLARIERSFERERRFSSDLAHELRTPLAELRSAAECALKWPESRHPEFDRETLEIAGSMEGMVARMLALARSDQGELEPQREPVVLANLVRDRWEHLAGRAQERGLRGEFALAPGSIAADPVMLGSIVDNLLENAVDYGAPGVIVIVADPLSPEILRVSNQVTDFTPDDLPRLFERFWRKEASRTGGRHVGLGLSLARAFAEAMGGRLEARMPGEAGIELVLTQLSYS